MFGYIVWTILFSVLLLCVNQILAAPQKEKHVLSRIVISQNGRFAIDFQQPMAMSREMELEEFMGYVDPKNTTTKLFLGPIFGEDKLEKICANPDFLKKEKLVNVSKPFVPQYFTKPYSGCKLALESKKVAIILEHPQKYTDQQGRDVKFIGIVADKASEEKILNHLKFAITAKDLYLNLLQLGSVYSPYSSEIAWEVIQKQGLDNIKNNQDLNEALRVANKYYIPKLHAIDHHTCIIGDKSVENSAAANVSNVKLQKWLSTPMEIKSKIWKYCADFHGKNFGDISYIFIPAIEAYSPEQINDYVKKGRELLRQTKLENSRGIIVDLRCNTGGNVKPMLLILGGILPEGKLFGLNAHAFVSLSSNGNKLSISDSEEIYGEYLGEKPQFKRNKAVAILTNQFTASAGEITALSLKNNMSKSKVFGKTTAGSLSTNQTFFLWNNSTFNLMFERIYNNAGKPVPLELPPDQDIEENFATMFDDEKDETINSAIHWLRGMRK